MQVSAYGLFARSDHPLGWGGVGRDERGASGAHGYVVLLVGPCNDDELAQVRERMLHGPFYGLPESGQYMDGNLREWFGGRFDYLAVVDNPELPGPQEIWGRFRAIGDNRFVGIFAPDEVLQRADA